MRYCIDCKHCKITSVPLQDGCAADYECKMFPLRTDGVTGSTTLYACAVAREMRDKCNHGNFFEPTLGARLIHLFTREDF